MQTPWFVPTHAIKNRNLPLGDFILRDLLFSQALPLLSCRGADCNTTKERRCKLGWSEVHAGCLPCGMAYGVIVRGAAVTFELNGEYSLLQKHNQGRASLERPNVSNGTCLSVLCLSCGYQPLPMLRATNVSTECESNESRPR